MKLAIFGLIVLVISVGIPSHADEGGHIRTIQARVVRDTTCFGSTLRVTPMPATVIPTRIEMPSPELFEVEVPENAEILKLGRKISAHEIRTGDVVHAEGFWGSKKFFVSKAIVNVDEQWQSFERGREYRKLQGTATQVDHLERRFLLETWGGSRVIFADRARIWGNGNFADIDQLQDGDFVWVRGNVDGLFIDAERIEISRRE